MLGGRTGPAAQRRHVQRDPHPARIPRPPRSGRGYTGARVDEIAAIRRLAELTFDHHDAHPDFIRLVSIENTHEAVHLATLPTLHELRARPSR